MVARNLGRKFGGAHRILTSLTSLTSPTSLTYTDTHVFNRRNAKSRELKDRREWEKMAVPAIISIANFEAVQASLAARNPPQSTASGGPQPDAPARHYPLHDLRHWHELEDRQERALSLLHVCRLCAERSYRLAGPVHPDCGPGWHGVGASV